MRRSVFSAFAIICGRCEPGHGSRSGRGTRGMTSTAQAQYAGAQPRQSLTVIMGASSIGTLIEWYDFYLYGVLAAFFARHFFPPGDESLALLASLAVFWFGF